MSEIKAEPSESRKYPVGLRRLRTAHRWGARQMSLGREGAAPVALLHVEPKGLSVALDLARRRRGEVCSDDKHPAVCKVV